LREWRNRQTRWIQVPVSERTWGFDSPLAHNFVAGFGAGATMLHAIRCGRVANRHGPLRLPLKPEIPETPWVRCESVGARWARHE